MQKVAKAMRVPGEQRELTSGMHVPTARTRPWASWSTRSWCTEAAVHRRIREAVETKKLTKKAPALLRADA